jgi:hypothetical protein
MTPDRNRIFVRDPFADAVEMGLRWPARRAVRVRLVIEMVAQLHDALTDPFVWETEAYATFVRTVRLLNVYLPEGSRR